MGRERKRDEELPRVRASFRGEGGGAQHTTPLGVSVHAPESGAIREERSGKWFQAAGPKHRSRSALSWRPAVPLLLLSLVLATVGQGFLLRVFLPIVLTGAGIAILVRTTRKDGTALPSRRGLLLEGGKIHFQPNGLEIPRPLLSVEVPFGVTLVSTFRRDRIVAALSSADGTFYVGASIDAQSRRMFAPWLDRACTVGSDEEGIDAIGPDGQPLELLPADWISLIEVLTQSDPTCLDRLLLSDARGEPIALDGRELRVGSKCFDLTAPLEWRALVFQESFGQAVAVYQGTWVRQGVNEMVFVSLLPSLLPAAPEDGMMVLDGGILRDLRLMQAYPEQPPPRDQRIALDRIFMLPVRTALDRAPRSSQQPTRARA